MTELSVIQLIHTTLMRHGEGIPGDPIRCIDQWYDMEGNLVFEYDPHTKVSNYHRP